MIQPKFDVLIVGGGPAGMAAAHAAMENGRRVGIIDENHSLGGQIWRGSKTKSDSPQATEWHKRLEPSDVEPLVGTRVIDCPQAGSLLVETQDNVRLLRYRKLILATGARELFLPFPGWTTPGVFGVGGLQALVKSGYPVQGKRIVVTGTGPLLLAAAACFRREGATVQLIAEQAPMTRLVRFGIGLAFHPGKLLEAARYKRHLLSVRYRTACWPIRAEGQDDRLSRVTLQSGSKTVSIECDMLACGFGFVPNLELPQLLGCLCKAGLVDVDPWQATSVAGVFAAGETTGIGGVECSLIEGRIAGLSAVGKEDEATREFAKRDRARRFARSMNRAFALRDELIETIPPETIVCRCEDVTHARLTRFDSWRSAKLQTRCGMGSCQGRVCGAATEVLFGWTRESIRPPIFPTPLENLAETDTLAIRSTTPDH